MDYPARDPILQVLYVAQVQERMEYNKPTRWTWGESRYAGRFRMVLKGPVTK
jgi:hypothetical protein